MFYKSNLNANKKDFTFSGNGPCTTELAGFTHRTVHLPHEGGHGSLTLYTEATGNAHSASWPVAAGGGAC